MCVDYIVVLCCVCGLHVCVCVDYMYVVLSCVCVDYMYVVLCCVCGLHVCCVVTCMLCRVVLFLLCLCFVLYCTLPY